MLGQTWVYNWCESRPDTEQVIAEALSSHKQLQQQLMSLLHRVLRSKEYDARRIRMRGLGIELPPGIRLYEVAGPMFFGAAKSAMEVIATVGSGNDHTFVLNMQYVPTIDVTALVALESALDRLFRSRIKVIFAGLTPEVAEVLDRAGIKREPGRLAYAPDVETAISMAIVHAARLPGSLEPPIAAA